MFGVRYSIFGVFCIPALIIGTTLPAFTQPDTLSSRFHGLQFDAGLIHNRLVDEGLTASRLLFRGTAFKIKAGYWMSAEKFNLGGHLDFSTGDIQTTEDRLESKIIGINLYLFYLRRIAEYNVFERPGKLLAGLELASQNIVIDGIEVLDNVSVLFAQGLNTSVSQEILLSNTRSLHLGLVIPVVSFAKRESYDSGVNDELKEEADNPGQLLFNDSRFVFIPGVRLKTAYARALGQQVSFVLAYEFRYLNNRQTMPLRIYSNELTAGLKIKFK